MTVKELRTLVDNLDEYIHVPGGIERLKKTVLHLAVSGQLVPQKAEEGTGEELHAQIQAEKQKLIAEGKLKKQKPLPEISNDEGLFKLPGSWAWIRLDEVADYRKGPFGSSLTKSMFVPKSQDSIKVYEQKNAIQKDATLGTYYIKKDYFESKMSGFAVQPHDIIVSCAGTIGEMYTLPIDCEVGIINQALMRVRLTTLMNKRFYLECLDQAITTNMDKAMGTAIKNIPPFAILKRIVIPLPPRQEQDRIIQKVDTIFALIDELAEKYAAEQAEREKLVASSLAQLSRGQGSVAFQYLTQIIRTKRDAAKLRQTILHLAVSGQLVTQKPEEGTGEELYQQIQAEKQKLTAEGKLKKQKLLPEITADEIPFEIPKSWKWVRTVDTGYSLGQKKPDKDFYYIDVASIDNASQKLKNPVSTKAKDAPSRARKIVDAGSVIYSTVRPYLLNATVVKNQYAHELIASTAFAVLHPYSGVASNWVLMCLISQYFTDYTNEKSVGAAYPAINDAQFSRGLIPLPPLAEQTRIVQKTTQLLDLVTELEKHLEK